MTLQLKFSAADRDRIRQDLGAGWDHDLDRPLVVIERIEGHDHAPELMKDIVPRAITFPLDVPADEVIDFNAELLPKTPYYGDAFPRLFADFGTGVAAGF